MIKNVHLGFFINEYNTDPIYYELASFKDADELDRFMDYFYNNNKKIRKQFDQDISEYSIDNIEQFRKVEQSREKNFNFRGRISAYYFNELGKMEFLELPTSKTKPIRDYKRLPDLETCYRYLTKVFNDAEEKINKRYEDSPYGPPKSEFMHYICEKLKQSGYELSDNELRTLACYYNHSNAKNKKDCFTLMKVNLKSYYLKKEEKRRQEEQEHLREEMKRYEEEVWQEILESSSYDEEVIDRYPNAFKKGK